MDPSRNDIPRAGRALRHHGSGKDSTVPPGRRADDSTVEPAGPSVARRGLLRGVAAAGLTTGLAAGLAVDPFTAAPAQAAAGTAGNAGDAGDTDGDAGTFADDAPGGTPVTLDGPPLLCEPYLLDPYEHGVRVVWHTEEAGTTHVVIVGAAVAAMSAQQVLDAAVGSPDRSSRAGGTTSGSTTPGSTTSGSTTSGSTTSGSTMPGWRRFTAETLRLTRTREDASSRVPGKVYTSVQPRPIHRHLAEVRGLRAGRTPYRVVSIDGARRATVSQAYSLAPALAPHASARLLLTSDHQLKAMTPANLEAVGQTVGTALDGVLMAGDCVNVPDRASEWFDSTGGPAFFAAFTGRANKTIGGRAYRGAPILQHTPFYPAVGNHEVMGRPSTTATLDSQFNDAHPIEAAIRRWEEEQPTGVSRDAWLAEHSWNTGTYEDLFPYPRSTAGGPRWYGRAIGDVFVVSLFVACVWRGGATTGRGKFSEAADSLHDQDAWGFGQFIFEPIKRGSRQYAWLERTLRSRAARRARYRVVMFHHPSHGIGDNSAPALTDPVQSLTLDPTSGRLTSVTYAYPPAADHVLRDVEPLLDSHGVNLVLNGHSHLWSRFRSPAGVNWLETSNVGNTYGAFDAASGRSRHVPDDGHNVLRGDPGGLAPVVPTLAPLTGPDGTPLPYVASDTMTAFSVLDSAAGTVRSYRFDTAAPASSPVLFDEFPLG